MKDIGYLRSYIYIYNNIIYTLFHWSMYQGTTIDHVYNKWKSVWKKNVVSQLIKNNYWIFINTVQTEI